MVLGQVLGTLAGTDDLEARRPRPVHQLADEGGLVAVGQRVHYPGLPRAAGEEGPHQGIGLDVDHDEVSAMIETPKRVMDAHSRITGRLYDHLDAICGDHRFDVFRDVCGA